MSDNPGNLPSEAAEPPAHDLSGQSSAPFLRPSEIWTPRDLLLFLAFIPFALVASNLAGLMGYAVLRPFARWQATADAVKSDTFFLLIVQCAFYIFMMGFIFLLAKLQHHQPFWKSLGGKKVTIRQAAACLLGGALLAIVVDLALVMQPDPQGFPLEKLFNSRAACYAIGTFAIAVAPVVEELVFRGLLFAVLEHVVGLNFAVLGTAVLFAGLHLQEYWHAWNHMLMILAVGLVFSLARGLTGSITPGIILHTGYNSLMMVGLFFSSQHFREAQSFLTRG